MLTRDEVRDIRADLVRLEVRGRGADSAVCCIDCGGTPPPGHQEHDGCDGECIEHNDSCDLAGIIDLLSDHLAHPELMANEPIPMQMYCPSCGVQHIDAADSAAGWDNPPHRSHKCLYCGCIWRPADVPTTGVGAIGTSGQADTWPRYAGNAYAGNAEADAHARPLHLVWNGSEWVDERCGCRYHPLDPNGTHGGGPHIHPCAQHGPDHR